MCVCVCVCVCVKNSSVLSIVTERTRILFDGMMRRNSNEINLSTYLGKEGCWQVQMVMSPSVDILFSALANVLNDLVSNEMSGPLDHSYIGDLQAVLKHIYIYIWAPHTPTFCTTDGGTTTTKVWASRKSCQRSSWTEKSLCGQWTKEASCKEFVGRYCA